MKNYKSPISTIRHIMLEYGGGVVPAMRKREGGEVKPVDKKDKKKKVDSSMPVETTESRVDHIRGIVEDLGKMERRIQAGDRREGDEARIKQMYDKQVRVQREKGDLPAELQKERPSRDVEGRMEAKTRLKNMKPTPTGETRYYRPDGTDVTSAVNFRNSIGGEHHGTVESQFTAHPEHKQMVQRTSLSSSVPPAQALHGIFTKTSDPQGKDPHIAVMAAYGGPYHPEGGAERTVEPLMMSIKNFRSARANLPRGVSLTTGGVPQDFINHAVGDNEHPMSLQRK